MNPRYRWCVPAPPLVIARSNAIRASRVAARADADVADFARAIRSETLERRHADIGGDVPGRQVDFRAGEKIEHAKACCVVDGREVETRSVLLGRGALSPKRCRVALDQFAQMRGSSPPSM